MKPDQSELIDSGQRNGLAAAEIVERSIGRASASAYAAGMILGARQYLERCYGPRSTYNILAGIADDALNPALTLATLEAEIAEIVRRLRREGQCR